MEALIAATPGLSVPGFGADAGERQLRRLALHLRRPRAVLRRGRAAVRRAGRRDDIPSPRRAALRFRCRPASRCIFALRLVAGARATSFLGGPLHPHAFPAAIASRFTDDGRPPCVDCGLCSGFGCPNNSKGAPPVTTLRRALLSGRCQLRYEAQVIRLMSSGRTVTGVQYFDADGAQQTATAIAFILAASPVESARLCLLSGNLGNSSGQVGRNLMFHFQTNVNGLPAERVHGQRGRAVTHGISDFRGVEPGGATIRVVRAPTGRTSTWAASASSARRRAFPSPRTARSMPSSSRAARPSLWPRAQERAA